MSSEILSRCIAFGMFASNLLTPTAVADVAGGPEVHGFLTQGFVKTTANSFFGDSEDGSFDFTELGVNATWEPFPNLRLSGQLLSRRAGEMDDGSPRVDFALADLSIASAVDTKFNILVGRVKNPIGLYNETRDVAFTRPGVFLPQTVYFQRVRSLALSADGIALKLNRFFDVGNLEVQLGLGDPIIDENVEFAYLGRGFAGDYEADGLSWVGRIMFETPDQRWRFALSAAETSLDFDGAEEDLVGTGGTDLLFMVASAQYSAKTITVSLEYVQHPVGYSGFAGTLFQGASPTAEGYYLQAHWKLAADLALMLRYERGYIDKSDRNGNIFKSTTGLPAHSRFHKAFAFGARWDASPDFAFFAEYQHSKGTFTLSNRENLNPFDTERDWDMFAISASYRF